MANGSQVGPAPPELLESSRIETNDSISASTIDVFHRVTQLQWIRLRLISDSDLLLVDKMRKIFISGGLMGDLTMSSAHEKTELNFQLGF